MEFIIWGAGRRGELLLSKLGINNVKAFIDSNPSKIGTTVNGIPVIDYDCYTHNYNNHFIIVSNLVGTDDVENFLISNNNYRYFILSNTPQELLGRGRIDILNNLPFLFDINRRNYIYGISLFGILLYEKLKSMGGEVYLVPSESEIDKRKEIFKEEFTNNYKVIIDDIEPCNVFRTVKEDKLFNKMHNVFDCYDFSYQIPEYRHLELKRFNNIHSGKRAFIVATGPSLDIKDLDKLNKHNEISFSMNRIYDCFDSTNWRPDYYFISDDLMYKQNQDKVENLTIDNVFITDVSLQDYKINKNYYRFYHDNSSYKYIGHRFSDDVTICTWSYGSVLHIVMQFAVNMGIKELYLIGVDFNYSLKNNHFYKNEIGIQNIFDKENVYAGYLAAKQYADSHGIKIYNATRGGKLEVFPRVDFDSLFVND